MMGLEVEVWGWETIAVRSNGLVCPHSIVPSSGVSDRYGHSPQSKTGVRAHR